MKLSVRFVISGFAIIVAIAVFALAVSGEHSHEKTATADSQWEYLVVAGGNANLSTAGNEQYPNMRKQPDSSFAREFFPLERNFDKLGAKGWELITVYGPPTEPIYYFKRQKEAK